MNIVKALAQELESHGLKVIDTAYSFRDDRLQFRHPRTSEAYLKTTSAPTYVHVSRMVDGTCPVTGSQVTARLARFLTAGQTMQWSFEIYYTGGGHG